MNPLRRASRRGLGRLALLIFGALSLGACATSSELQPYPVDLVLRGGQLIPIEGVPQSNAAIAVSDGRIAWLGPNAEADAWVGEQTRVVELRGMTVLPGFADAHFHLRSYASHLANLELVGTTSFEQITQRVAAEVATRPSGEWILGGGWDQNDWGTQAQDDALDRDFRALLDAVAPDHPVALRRVDGHALMANSAALAAADLDEHTADPPGGRLLRTRTGALNGVLIDRAFEPLGAVIPRPSDTEMRRRLAAAIAQLHAYGITSIHDAGTARADIALYRALDAEAEFPLRAHLMMSADELTGLGFDQLDGRPTPAPSAASDASPRIALRAIKLSSDGALGSRGARLLEDYSDDPGNRGLFLVDEEQTLRLAAFALRDGWQLNTHAIGDAANRMVLDAYAAALDEHPRKDHRFRIEHAQILHPDDVARFAALGVTPSMQAQHQTSDAPWAGERLGEARTELAYAWRTLLDTGVTIPGGSDAPVEVPDPLRALRSALTRIDASGWPEGGWHPEQVMTREEALASITLWAARASFREDDLGSLAVGKRADLVVLSHDPLTLPLERLDELRVLRTLFDGELVFSREAKAP